MDQEVSRQEQLEQLLQEALQDRRLLQDLAESKGWLRLKEIMKASILLLEKDLTVECDGISDILRAERIKGSRIGQLKMMNLAETIVENAEATIPEIKAMLDIKDDNDE